MLSIWICRGMLNPFISYIHRYMKCIYVFVRCILLIQNVFWFSSYVFEEGRDFQRLESCFYAYVAKVCKIEVGNRKSWPNILGVHSSRGGSSQKLLRSGWVFSFWSGRAILVCSFGSLWVKNQSILSHFGSLQVHLRLYQPLVHS